MSLLVTTQSYRRGEPTPYGLLLDLDTVTGEITCSARIETPVSHPSKQVGGRLKPGLRGIYKYREKIYVACWNRVVVLDASDLSICSEMSHKWMSDLHGIYADSDGVWVTSSLPDTVVLYGLDGAPRSALWLTETSLYEERCRLDPATDWRWRGKDFEGFKDVHANNVTARGDHIYITGRGRSGVNGQVIRVPRRAFLERERLSEGDYDIFASGLHGPHDGMWVGDQFLVTETRGSTICRMDEEGNVLEREKVLAPGERVPYEGFWDWARHFVKGRVLRRGGKRVMHWTRGLAATTESIFVGQSTWEGDPNSAARVVAFDRDLSFKREYKLEVPNYPELRIFQLWPHA